MVIKSIEDVLVNELRDLYNAEVQSVELLSNMREAAISTRLKGVFAVHLDRTVDHLNRIEDVCRTLHTSPRGKPCYAMGGLFREILDLIFGETSPEVLDLGLIAGARRMEHYEIAAYGMVRICAAELGLEEVEQLMSRTLNEAKEADQELAELAGELMHEEARGSFEPPNAFIPAPMTENEMLEVRKAS